MVEVRDIDYGIAFQVTNSKTGEKYIEINKYLNEDPILYAAVLGHELEHYDSNKLIDFWLDLKPTWYSWRLFKWCLKHPKSFFFMSPVFLERGKKPVISWFMMLFWASLLGLMTLEVYLIYLLRSNIFT